jgi:hypothetical protein
VQKIDYPPNAKAAAGTAGAAAGQWNCRCSRHRRCSSRATDAKVRCTIRCVSNESKNRKVHCQERRSPAHPTQTRIVALSSAIPVQEWSHLQSQHQHKNRRIVKCNTSSSIPQEIRAAHSADVTGTHWTASPQRPGGTASERGNASWSRAASRRSARTGPDRINSGPTATRLSP